jgi:hypothetical protein
MLSAKDIHGVIPAIVTPFTSSDEVDIKALKAITRYALEEGVHGIMTTSIPLFVWVGKASFLQRPVSFHGKWYKSMRPSKRETM